MDRAAPLEDQAGHRRATPSALARVCVPHAPPGRGESVYLLEPSDLQVTLARHTRVFTAWSKAVMRTGHTAMSDLHLSTATRRPTRVIATPVRGAIGQPSERVEDHGVGACQRGSPHTHDPGECPDAVRLLGMSWVLFN